MTRFLIRHSTRYDYDRPVGFGPHRLLVRPRDSHALRVVEAKLLFSPPGSTRWTYDALGNSICWLLPEGQATILSIVSELVIERFPAPIAELQVADPHTALPIVYDPADRGVLAPFIEPVAPDPDGVLLSWLREHAGRTDEPALGYLLRLNQTIRDSFAYGQREEEGVQDPGETIARASGTCRDFAWLMVEALRRLGYAARFVTGYIYSPAAAAIRGAGATHAWCEAFLPGLGWMEFDPTNGLAESAELFPVAVARTPDQAAPVSGSIIGDPGVSRLFVQVDVRPADVLVEAA
jgi:YD repeat-containing protein